MLADWAVASENDAEEAKPGVAEIQVSESGKLVDCWKTCLVGLKIRDSHSHSSKEEDLRTFTNTRESCPQNTVRT